ncbi:hypothetical protein ACHHYP_07797 [Achlya hypogyna]|uniref:Uncharacterized protein n=1 Tax=Achlya hypogyna TaxID=1202772 RepID=A0A1V9YQD7_ACHHY|nr:hypothetical protein ACHHYP_07797 [Achlya hypogyna]
MNDVVNTAGATPEHLRESTHKDVTQRSQCSLKTENERDGSKLHQLQAKAEYLFLQLQARDKDLRLYEAKVATYLTFEGQTSNKIQELQAQVAYYRDKLKEVEQLRRVDMDEHGALRQRIRALEELLDDQRAAQQRLQHEAVGTRSALMEQEAIVAQRDKTIAHMRAQQAADENQFSAVALFKGALDLPFT